MYMDVAALRARRSARPEPIPGVRLAKLSYGRFLQADPIGYGDGMNMYGYVGGDPVNFTDSSGNSRIDYYRMHMHSEEGRSGSSGAGRQFESSFFAGQLLASGHYKYDAPIPQLQYEPTGAMEDDKLSYTEMRTKTAQVRGFCESAATCAMSRDDAALLSGRMTSREYNDNARARGFGAAAAAALVAAGPVGVRVLVSGGSTIALASRVTWGHGARHLAGTGLSQFQVEMRILLNLKARVDAGILPSSGAFRGVVQVRGVNITYRGYARPNGQINIGTYYPPKP